MGFKIHKNRDAIHFSNRAKLLFCNLKGCDRRLHFFREIISLGVSFYGMGREKYINGQECNVAFLVIILIQTPSELQKSDSD